MAARPSTPDTHSSETMTDPINEYGKTEAGGRLTAIGVCDTALAARILLLGSGRVAQANVKPKTRRVQPDATV